MAVAGFTYTVTEAQVVVVLLQGEVPTLRTQQVVFVVGLWVIETPV